jgi:Holliday junction DNA helicase RuvA
MIGRLRGSLVVKQPERVVLDVAGVGYEVAVTPRAQLDLPGIGEDAVLHVHLHVREDALAMVGFPTEDERDTFRVLVAVPGIGLKVAMAILGTLTVPDLRRAVLTDDVAALTMVPGIGKRSAQKLMLELRPKFDGAEAVVATNGNLSEVRAALEGLGYEAAEISAAVSGLEAAQPVEDLLRAALRRIGGADDA